MSWEALRAAAGCEDCEGRLSDPVEVETAARLREATLAGRPYAASEFVDELERRLGRRLRPRPMGRPKRAVSAAAGSR